MASVCSLLMHDFREIMQGLPVSAFKPNRTTTIRLQMRFIV